MRILVCLLHFGYHRNFASVIRELARRGHHVHVAAEKSDRDRSRDVLAALAAEFPSLTIGHLPSREDDIFKPLAQRMRLGTDYLRYLGPDYQGMPGLKMRSEDRVPVGLLRLLEVPGVDTAPVRGLLRASLHALERAIPPSTAIDRYLREQQPDVMLVTPLLGVVASSQVDYVAAAKRLGIPTGFCVWSWDNLSSKALLRDIPDRVFVWNETQKEEAVRLHRIPADHVVVTGAQCFDQWFGYEPTHTRGDFCQAVGLPSDKPYILYVCSAMLWKSTPEADFVVRWIRHLRGSADPILRDASILIRPHPGRLDEWSNIRLDAFEHVSLSPGREPVAGTGAAYPIDASSKAAYLDALYHSAAVVGINTSAFIEATIVGRPVYVVLAPEFSGSQTGTIHFRYLTDIGGGAVCTGREFDEHEAQLSAGLASSDTPRRSGFLEAFVRPHGLDVAATPIFVEAVESLAHVDRRADERNPSSAVARAALRGLASVTRQGRGKLLLLTRHERDAALATDAHRVIRSRVGKRVTRYAKRVRSTTVTGLARVGPLRRLVRRVRGLTGHTGPR